MSFSTKSNWCFHLYLLHLYVDQDLMCAYLWSLTLGLVDCLCDFGMDHIQILSFSTMFGRTSGLTDMYSNALAFINTFHFIVPSMFCNLWLLVYSSNQKQETTCVFRINIQKHFCLFIYYKDRDFINMMFGTYCQLSIGFLFYLDFYILWSSFFFWNLCFVMLFNININSIIVLPFFEIFFVFDKIVC